MYIKKYLSRIMAVMLICSVSAGGSPVKAALNKTEAEAAAAAGQQAGMEEMEAPQTEAGEMETLQTEAVEAMGPVTGGGSPWPDTDLQANLSEDMELSPRDDFYLYVNHDWLFHEQFEEGMSSSASFLDAKKETDSRTIKILEDESLTGHDVSQVRSMYRAYLDWDARNAAGTEPLMKKIRDIQSISSMEELSDFLCDPERCRFADFFITLTINPSIRDSSRFVPIIYMSGLTLSDSAEYDQRTDYGDLCYRAYLNTAKALLTRIGYTEEEAQTMFDTMIGLEGQLAGDILSYAEQMSPDYYSLTDNFYNPDELKDLCDNFPLPDYIAGRGYGEADEINIQEPEAVRCLDDLYVQENLEAFKSTLIIRYVISMAEYLDEEAYELFWKQDNMLIGTEGRQDDSAAALAFVKTWAYPLLDKVYVEAGSYSDTKEQITELCEKTIGAYRSILEEEDWLSEQTREAAIEKLDHMQIHAAYPDKWIDYSSLDVEGCPLMDCLEAAARFYEDYDKSLVNKKVDPDIWSDDILEANAIYNFSNNAIYIFLGLLNSPVYYEGMSEEELYGMIGAVIGHEISHAFDTGGAQFDKDGNMKDWWKEEDYTAFWERAEKMINYYNNITVWEGTNAIGEYIVSEAIADIAGAKVMLVLAEEEEDFDYDAFFTSFAVYYRRVNTWEKENLLLYQDSHPLHYLRVNVTLQQFDEFLETYDIQEGDNMYLAPEDRISVW